MPIRKTIDDGGVAVHVWTDDVEGQALQQLLNVSRLPFVFRHVAAMPDVHAGIGATVGSVISTRGAILPAAVGVDIGCGMAAVRLSLTVASLPDKLNRVRGAIEAAVPVGFGRHDAGDALEHAAQPFARALEAHRGQAPEARDDAERLRLHLGASARDARRREPLHRGVPRRGANACG